MAVPTVRRSTSGVNLVLVAYATLAVVAVPLPAAAHGFGGRSDLPVPLGVFVVATALALVATFVALFLRPQVAITPPAAAGRRLGGLWTALAILGALFLALTVVTGIAGVDNSSRNPAAVIVFIGFWLLIPFTAALVVNLYPALSPWRRLPEWLGLEAAERPDLLDRLGYWPATAVFLAFTWFELVAPNNGPRAIALAAVVFTLYMLGMSTWLGAATATDTADGFAVYSRFLGGMAPFAFEDGMWRRRPWMSGLASLPERTGMAAFVVAMIGTVTYDGGSSTTWWAEVVRDPLVSALTGWGLTVRGADLVAGTLGWMGAVTMIGLLYLSASAAVSRLTAEHPRRVARRFAHTLVPIGFAYAFAHYFTLVVFEGQLFLSTMADPLALGWDLFGTAGRRIDFTLIERPWIWSVQLAVIVAGHVAAVVLCHRRVAVDVPRHRAIAASYPLLALIVGLSALALLLAAFG